MSGRLPERRSARTAPAPPFPTEGAATLAEQQPTGVPIVFGGADAQLAGFFHAAASHAGGHVGAVLCSPLGYEAMCTHRTYRRLAERLAAAGVHAVRFDYHGTGDSSGELDDTERLRAWLVSVDAAVDELRALSGVGGVTLIGLRFGATLAALAAERRGDVQGLVLWAPCVVGRAYVRELRAFRALAEHGAGLGQARVGARGEDVAGHLFPREELAALASVDLLASRYVGVGRALVLARDDLPGAEPALVRRLIASGVEVELGATSGYAAMMRDAQETVVPWDTVEAIARWTRAAPVTAPRAAAPAPHRSRLLRARSTGARPAIHEEAVRFGPASRLFGVLSGPASASEPSDRPLVVYLNVGANHHVGPNRMYVSLARRLAEQGYLGFRMDVAGLGESSLGAGGPGEALYAAGSLDDISHALAFLAEARGSRRFVLVGLCSGAYLAFHGALREPRVVGQVLVNPQTFEWRAGDSLVIQRRQSYKSTRYYLGALADWGVWRRALRGELDHRGVAAVLRRRLWTRVTALSERVTGRAFGRATPRSEVERRFFELGDRGVESLLIFGSSDGGLDMIERHLGTDGERSRGPAHLRIEVVEGADHTFTLAGPRELLRARVTSFVCCNFP